MTGSPGQGFIDEYRRESVNQLFRVKPFVNWRPNGTPDRRAKGALTQSQFSQ